MKVNLLQRWSRELALISCISSLLLLFSSAFYPISLVDYSVNGISRLNQIDQMTENPCMVVDHLPEVGSLSTMAQKTCAAVVNSTSHTLRDIAFQQSLGNIGKISWKDCLEAKGEELNAISSRIEIPKTSLKRCFKLWTHTSLGIPLGESYLLEVIWDLYQRSEYVLFTILFIFTLIFPMSKIIISIFIIVTNQRQTAYEWYKRIEYLGKWSMADVFVVSLLVVFFKVDALSLKVSAQSGLYLFAASTLLSMISTHFIKEYIHRKTII